MEKQGYDNPNQAFQEGFNSGYILAVHDTKLLDRILWERELYDDDHTNGLRQGKWQYEQEMKKDKLQELGQLRNRSRGKDRDLDLEFC